MATEKTKLEWALGILMAIGGALGARNYFEQLAAQTAHNAVGSIVTQLTHDAGPEIMGEISKLNRNDALILLSRLTKPREPFTKTQLVNALGKIESDPQNGRRVMLAWLAELDENAFYEAMQIYFHAPLLEWARKLTNGRAAGENLASLRVVFAKIFTATGKTIKSAGRSIDTAAGNAAPTIGAFADWLEIHLANLKKEN